MVHPIFAADNITTHVVWLSLCKMAIYVSIVWITGLDSDWILTRHFLLARKPDNDLCHSYIFLVLFPLNRFAVSFISWGISFSAPFLGGNVYINVVISAAASLPRLPLCAALTVR